ncbi:MAG: tetratricopeptide repeat protein [Anaerolineae bacterium]|nr:tetratricopeptide repeat protein [Anaerolineae bacterium]
MAKLTQRLGLPRYEADEHYKLALAAFDKGDYDQAVDHLNKAIDLLPTKPEYYATRGYVYLRDGVREKAEADFDAALKRHEFEMLAHYGRGVLAYKDRNWEDAETFFSRALAVDPERAETLYYLALVYHRLKKNAAALDLMKKALEKFETLNDKRRSDARQWLRELEKQAAHTTPNPRPRLPL